MGSRLSAPVVFNKQRFNGVYAGQYFQHLIQQDGVCVCMCMCVYVCVHVTKCTGDKHHEQ